MLQESSVSHLLSKDDNGCTPILHNYGDLPLTFEGYWLVVYLILIPMAIIDVRKECVCTITT